jgi:hypothetical protein
VSNKGYAAKYLDNGFWYKNTVTALSSKCEVLASRIAEYSNLASFVHYDLTNYNGVESSKSADFTDGAKVFISLEDAHISIAKSSLNMLSDRFVDKPEVTLEYTLNFVSESLGIAKETFLPYLSLMLKFDFLVLNEDRHFGNIGLLDGLLGTVFDFDCSLFANFEDFTDDGFKAMVNPAKCLPFARTHDKQLLIPLVSESATLEIEPFRPEGIAEGIWNSESEIGYGPIMAYIKSISGGMAIWRETTAALITCCSMMQCAVSASKTPVWQQSRSRTTSCCFLGVATLTAP